MYLPRNKHRLKKIGGNMTFRIFRRNDTSNLLLTIIYLIFFIKLAKMEKVNFKNEEIFLANIFERQRKDVMTKGSKYFTNYSFHVTGEK